MAIMIPEAAEAVSGGTAAVRGAAARGRLAPPGGATVSRARQGTGPRGGQQRELQFSQKAKKTGRGALKARLPGSHTYQPVILAEFLVAVVIVAVSPLAKGGTPEAQAKGSPSPYSVNSLKQLLAIGGVYFVLAILASSRRAGRLAAWFGGLVLLGLGFTQLLNGDLKAVFGVFGPSSGAPATAGPTGTTGGQPLFSPGTASSAANAAANALPAQQIASGALAPVTTTQSITFSQPGVATTTETTPGVTVA